MRIFAITIAALWLAGCASTYEWVKPGASAAQMARDDALCRQWAADRVIASRLDPFYQAQLRDNCLVQFGGYHAVKTSP